MCFVEFNIYGLILKPLVLYLCTLKNLSWKIQK